MNISINTGLKTNLSKLSKDELLHIIDRIDSDDILPREELINIAEHLLQNDMKSFDNHNLSQMIYLLKNQKVNLKQVQNVLLDYATRAKEGKINGGKRIRNKTKYNKKKIIINKSAKRIRKK